MAWNSEQELITSSRKAPRLDYRRRKKKINKITLVISYNKRGVKSLEGLHNWYGYEQLWHCFEKQSKRLI